MTRRKSAEEGELTDSEERLIRVLSDGRGHTVGELKRCLNDPDITDDEARSPVADVVRRLRKKIREGGYYIICDELSVPHRYVLTRRISPGE